ncbi:uncharacterized protein AB675_3773 [Cyphellophora attinorum]|uniref:Protein kinase domain-containing protein n=1 Tax=Cyphellophora attinorum TaxID=1664694 RepID=A0A0N1H3A6_9EURO|nr:uncharacterized protein AB675_3773 [Phialophora attinorum]KPI35276.1 hypothetical protein AB675_3773 [Phialophora attinorum]
MDQAAFPLASATGSSSKGQDAVQQRCFIEVEHRLEELLKIGECELKSTEEWEAENIPVNPALKEGFEPGGRYSEAVRIKDSHQDVVFKVMKILIPKFGMTYKAQDPGAIRDEILALKAVCGLPGFVGYHGLSLTYGRAPIFLHFQRGRCTDRCHQNTDCETEFFAIIATSYGGRTAHSIIEDQILQKSLVFNPTARLEGVRLLASIHLGVLAVLANAERVVGYENQDCHYNNVVVEVDTQQATPRAPITATAQTGHTSTTAPASREAFDFNIRVRLIDQGMARTNASEANSASTSSPEPVTEQVLQSNLRRWLAKVAGYRALANMLGDPWTNTRSLWANPFDARAKLDEMTDQQRQKARIWCVLSAAEGVEYEQEDGESTLFTATGMLQRLVDMGVTTHAEARRLMGEPR